MHAAAKQLQSEILIRLGGYYDQLQQRVLAQEVGDRFDWVGGDSGFEEQDIGGKLFGRKMACVSATITRMNWPLPSPSCSCSTSTLAVAGVLAISLLAGRNDTHR